jgi:cystathionine beta-lyase/cystathionine gamma-synthase
MRFETTAIHAGDRPDAATGAVRAFYPGLESHTGHEIARKQIKGFGGVVSFELRGGIEGVNTFLSRLKVFSLAESLGGITSLAEHPATMSHASMPKDCREKVGMTDALIRLRSAWRILTI